MTALAERDVLKTGFLDNRFDLVLMTEVIEHIESPQKVIAEIYRILKPGGYLIISSPSYLNVAGIWKKMYEFTFHNTWDAWGTHSSGGTEHFTTSLKLEAWLHQESLKIYRTRGGDLIRSWIPILKKYYTFIDKHPFLALGKLWPIKYFLMNYFILCRKEDN